MIDSTMLKPDATKKDMKEVRETAIEYNFLTVAIWPTWISYAKELLKDSNMGIDAPAGFQKGIVQPNQKSLKQRKHYQKAQMR